MSAVSIAHFIGPRIARDIIMVCSPEQLASNRRNALKSKGPTSTEGRSKVAKNALKHGLTGEGIVVPDEDVVVIQERFDDFNTNLNPLGVVSEFLVRHLVMLSVRMDRCARHEAATLTQHMHLTVEAEADQAQAEFQALLARIDIQPKAVCKELESTPKGINWMISSWEDLKAALLDPDPDRWNATTVERAENLVGHRFVPPYATRICDLSGAYHGHLEGFEDWPDLPPADRRKAAHEELARIMDAEIARLEEVRAKLDGGKVRQARSRGDGPRPLRRLEGGRPGPEVRGGGRTRVLQDLEDDPGAERTRPSPIAAGRG